MLGFSSDGLSSLNGEFCPSLKDCTTVGEGGLPLSVSYSVDLDALTFPISALKTWSRRGYVELLRPEGCSSVCLSSVVGWSVPSLKACTRTG